MSDLKPDLRRAHPDDGAEMARLSAQLGYPMSDAEMTRRLTVLSTS